MSTRYKRGIGLVIAFLALSCFTMQDADASHFRYGTLSWEPLGGGEVEFTLIAAFRNGYGVSAVGDTFTETIGGTGMNFGDGSSSTGTLTFEVIDINVGDNFVIAVALDPDDGQRGIRHTYAGPGPYTAQMSGCCRIFDLNNRSSDDYRLTTTVHPNSTNGSPTTSLNPIVRIQENVNVATFTIPSADDEGDERRFRVASENEATGGSFNQGVPTFSIDPVSGLVTINTNTLPGSGFWTEQVIIEELDGDGNVRTVTPIDFFIEEVPEVGNPPVLAINPSGPLTVQVGNPVTFDVEATDPDDPETLDLNLNSALPPGASVSPALPISGSPPLLSTFSWTPTAGQEGSYVFNFTVEDSDNQQDQASITIDVVQQISCTMAIIENEVVQGSQGIATVFSPDGLVRLRMHTLTNLTVASVEGTGGETYSETSAGSNIYELDGGLTAAVRVEVAFDQVDPNVPNGVYNIEASSVCPTEQDELLEANLDPAIGFEAIAPAAFELDAAYPNPFRQQTTISFDLAESADVELAIYDVLGRKVATLADRAYQAGTQSLIWKGVDQNGNAMAPGTYLYRLEAHSKSGGNYVQTRQLVLFR